MPSLDRRDSVHILDLGDTENRFHPDWLTDVEQLIDEVGATTGPAALVTTATGKFFSNGLDLDWVGQHPEELEPYADRVQRFFARILTLPMPTVAAIQGHCFAAGAMLALAHDWRTMRADRGFFCLPEVDIGIPFTVGMDALIRAKLPTATAFEAMTTGKRYGGTDASAAGIVTATATESELLNQAVEYAQSLTGKAGATLGTIKERMFVGVVKALIGES